MLEGLVAWVLNNYLGQYVENLNTDQLSIALLSGEVELENLPLKKDALKNLDVPFEVRAGFIGRIRLQIPITQLRSSPWVVSLERLYVVVGRAKLDVSAQRERDLARLEAHWARVRPNIQQQQQSTQQTGYVSWLSYATADIAANLQLNIKDVHIRYEDSECSFDNLGLAFGLHVLSLSAQTCDESWKPQFTRRDETDSSKHQRYSFKTVDLDGFSVYCDKVPVDSLLSETNVMESMVELAKAMEYLGSPTSPHSYIISPVSGYAHVTRNCSESPLRSASTPRITCELSLDQVSMSLSDWQLENLVRTLDGARSRPSASPRGPRARWQHALRLIKPVTWTSWSVAKVYAREALDYVGACERALLSPTVAPSSQDKALKERVENERDLDQLWAFREAAVRRVPILQSDHTPPQTSLAYWFPQWWWGGKEPITAQQTEESSKQNKIIEGQILEALNEAITDSTLFKRDTVFGKFGFTLKKGVLTLKNNETPALELNFENFCSNIESRPRSNLFKLELSLGALFIRDLMTPDTLFPILIGVPQEMRFKQLSSTLFQLECEIGNGIKKLRVRSEPLDVVYNIGATKWLLEFLFGPQRRQSVKLEAKKTKRRLIKNFESIVEGKEVNIGSPWQLYLDISAPKVILVERLTDSTSNVAIIDLGRLHVCNSKDSENFEVRVSNDDDDEEMFVTPCSTPPGSEASDSNSTVTMQTAENVNEKNGLSENLFHERLYEKYELELSDVQVLACRAKDVWKHAHSRGSSAAHVLERFTIAAKFERRLVRTSDPMYPALTLCASLPRLVAHVNEPKVNAVRAVLTSLFPETSSPDQQMDDDPSETQEDKCEKVQNPESLLLMVQLSLEHVSLQVQSRGRSIAELQISGASATYSRRPLDTAVTLTVHGLLLVDALQNHGPDFELLIASHRHVAMDSISGSLLDSEPTSPISPSSPDIPNPNRATSPITLTRALNGLVSPTPLIGDALISLEYTSIDGLEPLHIANIQFNTLDIIANQETIVELIGFVKRTFPNKKTSNETYFPKKESNLIKTELTFDFHRLNILLMRADDIAKKVATATMSGAKIQATFDGTKFDIQCSLGGLQLLDLTHDGRLNRRAFSVGQDPLAEPNLDAIYIKNDNEALIFNVKRNFDTEIKVRMASVWYTHSPKLLIELQSCAQEFEQYLANVARTIKAAAVDIVTIAQNSPKLKNNDKINLDIVLDSPVVVVPRSYDSAQVFVAHLGRITLDNANSEKNGEFYNIQVRDMNLFSLDTSSRRITSNFIPRAENLYNCDTLAEPLLHDTALKLHISRNIVITNMENQFLFEEEIPNKKFTNEILDINGSVVGALKISLSRAQYEQLLDTFRYLTTSETKTKINSEINVKLSDEKGILQMDPHVRAKMLRKGAQNTKTRHIAQKIFRLSFELPLFAIELKEDSKARVELQLRDFSFNCEQNLPYETNISVSLRSLHMDDLEQDFDAPLRHMAVSSAYEEEFYIGHVSNSCPDLAKNLPRFRTYMGSLPDHLEPGRPKKIPPRNNTPPPKSGENLVLISCLMVDPNLISEFDFVHKYNSVQRATQIDLNSLDLIVRPETWNLVFDFFGNGNVNSESKEVENCNVSDKKRISELCITVRALTVTLIKENGSRLAKTTVRTVKINKTFDESTLTSEIEGKLGRLTLIDLTEHGSIYRERFQTLGERALFFTHKKTSNEAKLRFEMATVLYVHTKRFVSELQSFFNRFATSKTENVTVKSKPNRTFLEINAGAPIILLPVSSRSTDILVADLGRLNVNNLFVNRDAKIFDIISIELLDMDLYAAELKKIGGKIENSLLLSEDVYIKRLGKSLLNEKCRLLVTVERLLDCDENIPSLSIKGDLSTLEGTLELTHYRLIKGLLAHNIGEPLEEILIQTNSKTVTPSSDYRTTLTLLQLGLQNVIVHLNLDNKPLASIHFIRSKLTIENFSDSAQDIDLLSQEIVVKDTRLNASNAFVDILGPAAHTVEKKNSGLEVHTRRQINYGEYTILLNNMRIMLLPSWWISVREFIFVEPLGAPIQTVIKTENIIVPYELKINVTNSELVAVEDSSRLDTTALTLRSTTVLNWRPFALKEKPLSCSLNHCEVFTCVLGKESETALSILDPITVGVELSIHGALELTIQQTLNIRLSYHDVLMLTEMIKSLNEQVTSNANEIKSDNVKRLIGLGFSQNDCVEALNKCKNIEDAALWLTHNATIHKSRCTSFILSATCIVLTFIDDCLDSDVPLLELCLSELILDQSLLISEDKGGTLQCKLNCDYFNRALSGWEPCIEPWKCEISWHESVGHRFLMDLRSDVLLDINITSALIELYKLVGESWRKDMELEKKPRRRFVPFALKNDTGTRLGFITSLSVRLDDENNDDLTENENDIDDLDWKWVESGEIVPFEYPGTRRRQRHGDTHRARMHSLKIRMLGWKKYARVSIDRVGVYFRDISCRESNLTAPDKARIVFDVKLDGQARKLVTIRSALVITNKLNTAINISLGASFEHKLTHLETFSAPLELSYQKIRIKPHSNNFGYCQPEIDWRGENKMRHEMRLCRAGSRINPFYFSALIKTELWPPDNILPSHTITLLPSVLIVNLLPHDLYFSLKRTKNHSEGIVNPGSEFSVNTICAEDENYNDSSELEIKVRLEGFKCCTGVKITSSNDAQYNIKLEDALLRRLTLRLFVIRKCESAALKITVSAPYWILNRTGLPLIFRQEGVSFDTAGQFKENELARMVAPLLFSWSDCDASPSVICRVGTAVSTNGQPLWCQNFHLRRGIQVRRLKVIHSNESKNWKPDTVYAVGIEIRPGKGRYRSTNIVTISPRYQLHNRTTKTLIFSQLCHANGNELKTTHVKAVSGCQVPFHWPRPDRDLLLCVNSENQNNWSGGLKIDVPRSLHVALRDLHDNKFLRLEVVARGASLHAIFVEANENLPPPLRIDNNSEVTITFSQKDVTYERIAKPGGKIPYAWDEPDSRAPILIVSAPGGATANCDMERLGPIAQLTYENFIYVAFLGTFEENFEDDSFGGIKSSEKIENQMLVLDVTEENGGKVSIARKQPGRRSQLWRMTSTGQLQHVGSPSDRILVLDIEGPAPQPTKGASRLALRRPDARRRSTQTWRFCADNRLCCAHENMSVQPREALWGLRQGGAAVLAPNYTTPTYRKNEGTPIEQKVGKQRMRPGSGFLSVEITTDGPTRVLNVRDDISERNKTKICENDNGNEFRIVLRLNEGLGLSLVGKGPPQELLYARFINLVAELTRNKDSRQLCLSVGDIQIDNQLFGADAQVVVYTPTKIKSGDPERQGPALSVSAEVQRSTKKFNGVHILRHLVFKVNALVITVEEQLLLRLAEFFGVGGEIKDNPQDQEQTDDLEEAKPNSEGVTTSNTIKYYFGVLSLSLGPVRLSVRTAKVAKLPKRLRSLRKYLGLTPLVQFEDASLAIEPYSRRHLLDSYLGTWRSVYSHFREELVWQAAVILGNVDFLGGPLGLMSDVSEGVSGLINERSVGALVMNVTHGISNSAAKVTDALGDGLGRILIMDETHEETRQRIRKVTGSGHLVAGIKGLGFGLLDGATGLFRHVYEGATTDGVQGALSGVGRGLVGIVAKPVVGVLDLAGEAARAVRDSSRSASRSSPTRLREPRVASTGPGGLLPRFGNGKDAFGQMYLHRLTRYEFFVAYGPLRCSGNDDLRVIVSSERVRVVTSANNVITEVRLEDIVGCTPVEDSVKFYVEMIVKGGDSNLFRRPRIRCDTELVAKWAARQINFARRMRNEKRHTLYSLDEGEGSVLM